MIEQIDLPAIPHYLEPKNNTAIASAMLVHPVPGLTPALLSSHDGFTSSWLSRAEFDTSFTAQMSAMRKKTGDPDAFLLTARSALPLGDALKSYYEEIGGEPPVITSIAANQDTSYAYFRDENNLTPAVEQGFIQETSRLKGILPSDANVCVVDQFVSSGYTIAYASELLVNAGAANISGIRGSWYVQAYRRPSTEDTVHTTKMLRAVGRKAAQAGKDF